MEINPICETDEIDLFNMINSRVVSKGDGPVGSTEAMLLCNVMMVQLTYTYMHSNAMILLHEVQCDVVKHTGLRTW